MRLSLAYSSPDSPSYLCIELESNVASFKRCKEELDGLRYPGEGVLASQTKQKMADFLFTFEIISQRFRSFERKQHFDNPVLNELREYMEQAEEDICLKNLTKMVMSTHQVERSKRQH